MTVLAGSLAATQSDPFAKKMAAFVPKSPKEMSKLERGWLAAGFTHPRAAITYSLAEMATPVVLALPVYLYFGASRGSSLR